ncbi:hypothetical protein CV102_06030 [Natronococcus pandeyae]|uniref:Uncharacterized protein n=1 Tax=Natronococcus pandeyae TaxID=2055836 RepID=A0A8J8Q9K4_9EURY|nr:hypothetical protein [Natronococcus pandeyae]TYL39840.1 hypothetical protein CV102_06030 [Natronococcus pandeyae]
MDRRQYLRAGVALACSVSVAGCLDEVDAAAGSDDETDVEVTDRTGERALSRAVGRLNDAALALEVDDLEDDESAFDPEEPRELLADAREFLETAAAELEDDRQPEVDELRAYATVLEGLVDVAETVTDDAHEEDLDDVSEAITERELEAASETVDDLTETFDRAEERFDAAEADLDSLDADRLDALSIVDLAEIESGAEALGDVLASLIALVTALESTVEGDECLERGEEHADDDEHERARESFLDAEDAFAASTESLEDGREDTPAGLDSQFETGLCQNGHLETAARQFVAAAEATMDRDPHTARQRREDAEAALERVEDC